MNLSLRVLEAQTGINKNVWHAVKTETARLNGRHE
jgi:hypothetical protein